MKPQVRQYILFVGRDQNDRPYRALAPYYGGRPGLTDDYESLTNTQINITRRGIMAERQLLTDALTDLEHEAYRRLEALK